MIGSIIKHDMDLNCELPVTGAGNIAAGLWAAWRVSDLSFVMLNRK